VATAIALIAGGRLIRHAAPEVLLRDLDGRVWERVVRSEDVEAVRREWLVTGTARRADGIHMRIVSPERPGSGARPLPPVLEDAYLEAIGAHRQAVPA